MRELISGPSLLEPANGMDFFQLFATSFAIIIVVLLMTFFVCQVFGTKATAWIRSNREEKIGLSKSNMYNANGYLIQSGSEFLLSSTGSFKRFDSVDRDCKQESPRGVGGGGGQSSVGGPPLWNFPTTTEIPPQPLRPAPSPSSPPPFASTVAAAPSPPAPAATNKEGLIRQENLHPIKQQSLGSASIISTTTSVVPRPVARRQFSSPATTGVQYSPIKVPGSMLKIASGPKSCTNPFLVNPVSLPDLVSASLNSESRKSSAKIDEENSAKSGKVICNPFTSEAEQTFHGDRVKPFNSAGLIFNFEDVTMADQDLIKLEDVECSDLAKDTPESSLLEAEGSIKKLESASALNQNDQDYQKLLEHNKQNANNHNNVQGNINKYQDYPSADVSEEIPISFKRLRSHSETEVSIFDRLPTSSQAATAASTNPFLNFEVPTSHRTICKSYNMTFNSNNSVLSKTLSETYLGQYALSRTSAVLDNGPPSPVPTWTFGAKSLLRQSSATSLHKPTSNVGAMENHSLQDKPTTYGDNTSFRRTISCESVSSESSVLISDLELQTPPVTGYLCIGLQYDKNNVTEDGAELVVTVLEANLLVGPVDAAAMDTFVRIYLVPDETSALQTKLFRNSACPSYNETFSFWLNKKHLKHSLWFHLYHSGVAHTLIGEAELQVGDVKRPVTTWLTLSDSRNANSASSNWGELMFSLSYLPTAERLTVVVVKARNLSLSGTENAIQLSDPSADPMDLNCRRQSLPEVNNGEMENVFVKVYLLKDGKKVTKKRTSLKRQERSPIYNESMIFSVPPYMLNTIQVRLSVASSRDASTGESSTLRPALIQPIGHVIVGNGTTGKGLRHWNQMMTSLRKPVAMWHPLRQCLDRTQKTKV